MLTGVFTRFPADERPPARAVPFVCSDWPVFLTEKSHAPSMVTLWVSFTLGETPVRLGWMKQLCWTHPRGQRVPDMKVPVCWASRVCSRLVPKERGRLVQRAKCPSPPSPLQPSALQRDKGQRDPARSKAAACGLGFPPEPHAPGRSPAPRGGGGCVAPRCPGAPAGGTGWTARPSPAGLVVSLSTVRRRLEILFCSKSQATTEQMCFLMW